jgi:3-phenylpropionate/trans-cinnamate dioxygenase ferredoxin reductase component
MATSTTYLIVGAGLAGAKAAETLRAERFDGPLVLIGAENERPYERPPLSKDYLLGKADRETIYVHPQRWYAEHDVDLRLGTAVTGIDPGAHEVSLADGSRVGYSRLLLATGSSPRRLPVPGAGLDGVLHLRSASDSDRIKAAFQSVSKVVVIGGGWIGLETAAAARAGGVEVTVLERAELPLMGVLGRQAAQVFADLHRDHEVDLRCGAQVAGITGSKGRADGVLLADGSRVEADVIIAGVGITPNSQIAAAAGLEAGNGVQADAGLRSSSPDIYAAGDVANALGSALAAVSILTAVATKPALKAALRQQYRAWPMGRRPDRHRLLVGPAVRCLFRRTAPGQASGHPAVAGGTGPDRARFAPAAGPAPPRILRAGGGRGRPPHRLRERPEVLNGTW